MIVHLAPLAQGAVAFAGAALTASVPVLTTALLKRLKVRTNSDQWNAVMRVAGIAAGNAYKALAHAGATVGDVHIANGLMADAAALVAALAPKEIASLGLTPDRVAQIVAGELGKLFAADPTVSLGAAAPALPRPPAPATGYAWGDQGAAVPPRSAAPMAGGTSPL